MVFACLFCGKSWRYIFPSWTINTFHNMTRVERRIMTPMWSGRNLWRNYCFTTTRTKAIRIVWKKRTIQLILWSCKRSSGIHINASLVAVMTDNRSVLTAARTLVTVLTKELQKSRICSLGPLFFFFIYTFFTKSGCWIISVWLWSKTAPLPVC